MSIKLSPLKTSRSSSLDSKDPPEMSIITMTHSNKLDRIREYLDQNPDFEVMSVRDTRYYTLLHIACLNNHLGICEAFFKQITNQNVPNENIKKWVNAKTDEGFTALHFASFKGNIDIVKLLELHGADIHAMNFQGLTMIHIAAQGDQPVSIAYFQSKGLSIHEKDKKGSTPLHWAAFLGMENATNYLTSWGSEPNSIDNDSGLTPLHLGVISGNPRVVRRLLTRGANKSMRNKEGKMAVDFARENDDERIVYLLGNKNWFLRYLNIKPGLQRKRSRSSLLLFLFLFFITVFANVIFIFPFVESLTWVILFGTSAFLSFAFFLLSWLTNPGYMKNMQKEDILPLLLSNDPHLVCPDCVIRKPPRSRHCDFCDACISVYDHHCPWINNCVGSRNHAYFVWFTLFTLLAMLITLSMAAFHLNAITADYIYFPFFKYPKYEILFFTKNVVCAANFLSAIIFLVPLFALNYVQLANIFSGKTTSERYGYAPNPENLNLTITQSATSSMEDSYIRYRDEERGLRQRIRNCQLMCCLNKNDNRYNYRPMPLSKLSGQNLDTELSF